MKCSSCQEDKPASGQFFRRRSGKQTGLYRECRECEKGRSTLFRKRNPTYHSVWADKNRETRKAYAKEWMRTQRREAVKRLKMNMSTAIANSLGGRGKPDGWQRVLGFTLDQLKTHLERQFKAKMTWSNYGSSWHVDHIVPLSAFTFESTADQEFVAAWSLTNLRPLWKRPNLRKGAARTYLI